MEAQIQQMLISVLIRDRRIYAREGIALILERREQAGAPGEDIRGHGRGAGRQIEAATRRIRQLAIDVDAAEMVERPQLEGDAAVRLRSGWQSVKRVTQARHVERDAVDRDGGRALIVAIALQHCLEAGDVQPRAGDQPEGVDR